MLDLQHPPMIAGCGIAVIPSFPLTNFSKDFIFQILLSRISLGYCYFKIEAFTCKLLGSSMKKSRLQSYENAALCSSKIGTLVCRWVKSGGGAGSSQRSHSHALPCVLDAFGGFEFPLVGLAKLNWSL